MIPVLCVSRFQLIFGVILGVLTFMTVTGNQRIRYLIAAAAALIPLYIVLTIARSHDVAYLNGIFEMKNPQTPIFVTQPYMYIANNYDNFNCLVEELPRHSLGLKGMFPLWAFTGLKFLKPELVNWPLYTTKEELTTVTLFYDAYYDFGVAGVIFFAAALGAAAGALSVWYRRGTNPAWPAVLRAGGIVLYAFFFYDMVFQSDHMVLFWSDGRPLPFGAAGTAGRFKRTGGRRNNKREVFVMVSEKMKPFMANNSAIRAMFEEGNRMAEQYGRENVYDFSLGNPNVRCPRSTTRSLSW